MVSSKLWVLLGFTMTNATLMNSFCYQALTWPTKRNDVYLSCWFTDESRSSLSRNWYLGEQRPEQSSAMVSYNNRDALIIFTVLCSAFSIVEKNKQTNFDRRNVPGPSAWFRWDINTHVTRRDILVILLWKRVKDDARCHTVKTSNSIYIFLPAQ